MSEENIWGQVATWIWSRRGEVGRTLADLYQWYRGEKAPDAKPGIVILGAGGTGKSTLGQILSGTYEPLLDAVEPYSESIGVEEYSLKDDPKVELVVPPGQPHRRDTTWEDLLTELSRGELRGVVLVSAYGFHSLGEIPAEFIGMQSENTQAFLDEYTRQQRGEEIEVLERVLAHVGRSGKRTWLVSVVTKRDLWWPERADVEYYYSKGKYGELVNAFSASVNRRLFRHELVFLSLTINRFQTSRGELLRNNAAGYDHPLHYESQRRLFETLAALRAWENSE